MAELIGVSVRTIERRFQDFGLSVRATYTDISDIQLDEIVRGIMSNGTVAREFTKGVN